MSMTGFHTKPPAAKHESASHEMAQAQEALGLDETVCHDTHQRGHEQAHDALNGVEPGDLVSKSGTS